MNGLKSWWVRVCESHRRHVRLHHETQGRIIRDRIERDPANLLDRVRKLEKALEKSE